ncbi:alpha/beta hydrolase [Paenibacillus illinoisensis]|uniref:alpha/beta hydrolase n=1 Tax=Paenibacillus illinoisensis TaxID=59845 RepID=UPI000FD79867|nr:alpha/beta hydrolase [Paenibacillus illinoisensis]
MKDYTKSLPDHTVQYIGEQDLYLEIFEGDEIQGRSNHRPPLLFVHGAYTGSWMWSKYIPHFVQQGWTCYVMNLRSHYKSRVQDMTRVTFEDYLEDIQEIITECGEPPILIGFSMGGILSQKLAESSPLRGLVVIDSSLSQEVLRSVPYAEVDRITPGLVVPAPVHHELTSIDESAEDIAFQRKYLAMESSQAFSTFSAFFGGEDVVSINGESITCPSLVIKAVSSEEEEQRGRLTAEQLRAEYAGLWHTTHTGLLVGQRYIEAVEIILDWLQRRKSDFSS